jgi:hypothetical protein
MKIGQFQAFSTAMAILAISRLAAADTRFLHDGHTYILVEQGRTWAAAASDARLRQVAGLAGYLATIETAAENQAIFNQLTAHITPAEFNSTRAPDGGNGVFVWIAANDLAIEGDWIWDGDGDGSGQLFYRGQGRAGGGPIANAYHKWGLFGGASWEPDNGAGGLQDAAGIGVVDWPRGLASQWNDIRADNALYYVVEFNAVPEPSTAALLLIGFALVEMKRRRALQ